MRKCSDTDINPEIMIEKNCTAKKINGSNFWILLVVSSFRGGPSRQLKRKRSVKKIDVSTLRRYLEVWRSKRVPQGAQTDFFCSRDRLRRKGGNAHSLGSFPLFPPTGLIRTNCRSQAYMKNCTR